MCVAAYTGSSQGRPSCGMIAVTPVRIASGAPSSPGPPGRGPPRTPTTSVIAFEGPGVPRPIVMPRSRARRFGMARYDTRVGILGLGVSFRRAPVELLERLAFDDADLTKA